MYHCIGVMLILTLNVCNVLLTELLEQLGEIMNDGILILLLLLIVDELINTSDLNVYVYASQSKLSN
jgi:hypothetical protein